MELWIASNCWEAVAIALALRTSPGGDRASRVLLAASHAAIPEVDHWWRAGEPCKVRHTFDSVLDYNQIIAPYHPDFYGPNPRERYDLAGRIAALAGSSGVSLVGTCNPMSVPSTVIADLFPNVPIALVHAHGSDWNAGLPPYAAQLAQRVRVRRHLDLVSGMPPCLRGLKVDSLLASTAPSDIQAIRCSNEIEDETTRTLAIGLLGAGERSPSAELSIAQRSRRSAPRGGLTREQMIERTMRSLWKRVKQWVR